MDLKDTKEVETVASDPDRPWLRVSQLGLTGNSGMCVVWHANSGITYIDKIAARLQGNHSVFAGKSQVRLG